MNVPIVYFDNVISYVDTYKAAIYVKNFTDISSFNLSIGYDPTIMKVSNIPTSLKSGFGFLGSDKTEGLIKLGWFTYPAITLSDDAILIEFEFTKLKDGTSFLKFIEDHGFSDTNYEPYKNSEYINGSLTFKSENVVVNPITKINSVSTLESTEKLEISVENFLSIRAAKLTINYDSLVATATEVILTPGITGAMNYNINNTNGSILINWYTFPAIDLPNNSVFLTIKFNKNLGGATTIAFDNSGLNCRYTGNSGELDDSLASVYYIPGTLDFINPVVDPVDPVVDPVLGGGSSGISGDNGSSGTSIIDPIIDPVVDPIKKLEFPPKSKIIDKKNIMKYISKQVISKKCSNCKNYNNKRCELGNYVVASVGICEWFE